MSDLLRTTWAGPLLTWDGPNPCPPLTAAEDDALRRSMQEDGYIPAFPIVVSSGPACEGQIIDGFNRTRICDELGIEPVRIFHPCATELEFKILQIKANLERRQLTTSQRALLAVRLLPLYEERAAARMKAGKAQSAQSDPSAPVRQGKASEEAAESAGVSSRTVEQMKKITEAANADVLLEQISAGRKSIKAAYATLRDVETSIRSEAQAEKELAEHFAPSTVDAYNATLERATGDVIRWLMEADGFIRKHGVTAADVAALRSRPHTFTGVARRLNEWLGEIEEVL